MINLSYTKTINPSLLGLELLAVIEGVLIGISTQGDAVCVHVAATITQAQIDLIDAAVAAHNPALQTDRQAAVEDAAATIAAFSGVITNRITWHDENPATGDNALEVLQRIQTEWAMFMRIYRRDLMGKEQL